jgi:hypothetical protein
LDLRNAKEGSQERRSSEDSEGENLRRGAARFQVDVIQFFGTVRRARMGVERKMASTHGMIFDSAGKALSGVPEKQVTGLKLQFAHQLYDRCLERHGENHEQTRLVLDYISALQKPRLIN